MSLSVIPSALLIPPLNLVPLGLFGTLAGLRWPRFGRAVSGLAAVGLFVLSLPGVSASLLASLELGLPRDIPAGADPPGAIVVLSADAGYGAEGGILPGSGIGAITLDRMRGGAVLQREVRLPLLVTGGPLEDGAAPIADQMAESLREDFSARVKWVEPRAEDTWQNAEYSAALLRGDGVHAVYLVTSAWHMRRSLMAFRHFGIAATPAPLRFDRWPRWEIDTFVPHISSLLISYYALHEWIGCVYYAWRG